MTFSHGFVTDSPSSAQPDGATPPIPNDPGPAVRTNAVVAVLAFAGVVAAVMQTLVVPLIGELPELLDTTRSNATWVVTATCWPPPSPPRSADASATCTANAASCWAARHCLFNPSSLRHPGGGLVVAAPQPGRTRLCAHDAPPATAVPRARGAGRGGGLRPPRIRVHPRLRGPGGVAGHQDRQVHRATFYRITWRTVGAICGRVVADKLDLDRFTNLVEIGVDEISWRRHHKYLTMVSDHDTGKIVWGTEASTPPRSAPSSPTPCPRGPRSGSRRCRCRNGFSICWEWRCMPSMRTVACGSSSAAYEHCPPRAGRGSNVEIPSLRPQSEGGAVMGR